MSVTKIRSCLLYTVWIDKTHFAFSLSVRPNELISCKPFSYSTHLCNFFCGEIKTIALKKGFIIQESKVLVVSFCVLVVETRTIFFVNSDSFRRGIKPNQLPQLNCSEGTEHCCSNQKIHNVANSGGYFSSTKGARARSLAHAWPHPL